MSVEQNISQEIGHNGSHARAVIAGAVVVAVGVLVACALVIRRKKGVARVPEPAKSVDVDRYTGRWYEFARYDNRFERGRDFVTADYAKRDDGLISVINTGREGGADGPRRVARGKARVVPDSDNAKLKVSFFGPFYVGDYWVLDHADDYTWSIVGEPSGRFLWILTREARPSAQLRRMLFERAAALGYDTSRLRPTAQ